MPVNFYKVQDQVRALGELAPARQKEKRELVQLAQKHLDHYAGALDLLQDKVDHIVELFAPHLRCARPVTEHLNARFPLPPLPPQAMVLAADGSQIAPDRHAPVEYCLVNVGAICMHLGTDEPAKITIESHLMYDQELQTPNGTITEARLALERDLQERGILLRLAQQSSVRPMITFTDGPMELWGSVEHESQTNFKQSLAKYLDVLVALSRLGVITAGYIDKPSANPVVRLLEAVTLEEALLPEIAKLFPLRGVTDITLYRERLQPGERSAIFAMQSQAGREYHGALAIHFFYLNVGRQGHPDLARVEIPAWVAQDSSSVDLLHAVLVSQCRAMGSISYPYLLHRAHETALVSLAEQEQVSGMIALELRQRGVEVGDFSQKQAMKNLSGRTPYSRGGKR